jgi:predicted CDP-diglyceride synthetase/phosphatidate cytidylyltransferase
VEKKFWNGKSLFLVGGFLTFIGIGFQIIFYEPIQFNGSLISATIFGTTISTIGIVLLIRGHLMEKNSEKLKKDERSRKIGAWAASYSWMITVFALVIIFWINKLNIIQLGTDAVIGITYIVMVGSLIAYKYYFDKKGDIE